MYTHVCVSVCSLLPVIAVTFHLNSEMLTDSIQIRCRTQQQHTLFFLHEAIPLPAVFIILACGLCVCACVCVSSFKFDERNLLFKSKSGFPHSRVEHTSTGTRMHTHMLTMTVYVLYTRWYCLHASDGSTQMATRVVTHWCVYMATEQVGFTVHAHTLSRLPVFHPSKSLLLSSACWEHSLQPTNEMTSLWSW